MDSGPGHHLAVLEYHTLLSHFSSSFSSHLLGEDMSRRNGGRVDMFLNPKLGRSGPRSTAEIVAENSVESLRHAAHDFGLCARREGRVRDDSSNMPAEEVVINGSNNAKPEGLFPEFCDGRAEEVVNNGPNNAKPEGWPSQFCDGGLDTSLKSEADALAKERELFVAEAMASLGPCGSGLLAVTGVPEVARLRKRLLPLAKKLALMPDAIRRPVLKKFGLSTDVPLKRPDRPVSAFATKLHYTRHSHATHGSCISSPFSKSSPGCLCDVSNSKDLCNFSNSKDLSNASKGKDLSSGSDDLVCELESDSEQLGSIVKNLGASMVEIGLLVARLCDSAIPETHLEDAIWESGFAKARLIHYHAYSGKGLLARSANIGNGFTNKRGSRKLSKATQEFESELEETFREIEEAVQAVNAPPNPCPAPHDVGRVPEELWQEWHYDYGLLTILTAPMFLSSSPASTPPGECQSECESWPGGHTGLRILSRGFDDFVHVPPDCLIVQVGEAAQIASGGKLAAVAHCVSRPSNGEVDVSREMFVTFLQPAWDRALRPPIGVTRTEVLSLETKNSEPQESKEENFLSQEGSASANKLNEQYAKLSSVVPSLDSRWKEGCTFAEFSRETTAQYYGAHGRQSRRSG